MSTSFLLSDLLSTNADINYYTQQQLFWAQKYEANSAKLSKQVSYEEKWESSFDAAIDNTSELKASLNGQAIVVAKNNTNEALANTYADAKVSQYDEDLSAELAELDVDYDTMQTMYETLLESLRAQQESEKTATSTSAQDTGLLQG